MSPYATTGSARPALPAQQRADARGELVELERLHEVIVGAGVEARDAIGDRVARGQDQHGPRVAAPAHRAQHVEALLARQAEIEQQEVVHVLRERELGGAAVLHPVDGEAVLLQSALDASPIIRSSSASSRRIGNGAWSESGARAASRGDARARSRARCLRQVLGSNLSAAEFMQ